MDVYSSIPSINRVFQIFGLTQITIDPQNEEPPYKDRRWRNWSLVVICMVIGYGVLTLILFHGWSEDYLSQLLLYTKKLLIQTLHWTIFVETFLKWKKNLSIFSKLRKIDVAMDTVRVRNNAETRQIRRNIILQSWALLTTHVFCMIYFFSCLAINGHHDIYYIPMVDYYFCMTCIGLKCYQTYVFIYLTNVQFERLNSCLTSLQRKLGASPAENFRKLRIIQGIYDDLYELVRDICNFVGVMELMYIPNDIFNLVWIYFWLIWEIFKVGIYALSWYSYIIYSVPNIVIYLTLAFMCQTTIDNSVQLRINLHQVVIDIKNPQHSSLVEVFSLQLVHKPIKFLIYGIYKINLRALAALLMSFVSYLIVLLEVTGF